MKKTNYEFSFSFFSENKSTLGIDYTKGVMTTKHGEKRNYHEFIVGFIFFFFSFCISK
jgi:hypothetical protein